MTSNSFTVKNQGEVAAGPCRVTVVYVREARADSLNQVAENNEVNNIASHAGPDFC